MKKPDKELFVISKFKNKFVGDDGAVVGKWVYSKDLFFENTHFKREWFSLTQIAKKAIVVNISDAVAMNAKPKYALLGVSAPSNFTIEMLDELSKGFKKTAKKYGVKIIGGDTISGEKLSISVTIISKKRKYTLYRSGLKKDDLIAFTGKLGESKKDMEKLFSGEKIASDSRFAKPILRTEFIKKAAKYLRCGMDISDGLSKDISRLCGISKLGVLFFRKFDKNELCSGEEYEMLVAFSQKNRKKILKIAKKTKTPLDIFAKAVKGKYESECDEHHF